MRLRTNVTLGMSIVELMVAIVVATIVLMATTVALSAVHKMIVRARDHSLVREDVLVATRLIRSSVRVRTTEEVSIEDQGATLTIAPSGGIAKTITKMEMNLVRQTGGDNDILIRGRLSDLKFEFVPGHAAGTMLLKVTLTVAANDASSTASFTTGFRNKLET